jgi:hypothetical protein
VGRPFYEVIFFETTEGLANFKEGHCEMSAEVSAVAAVEGAALTAKYRRGVVVFTLPRNGLMAQATIGGQKFSYKPLDYARGSQRRERPEYLKVSSDAESNPSSDPVFFYVVVTPRTLG